MIQPHVTLNNQNPVIHDALHHRETGSWVLVWVPWSLLLELRAVGAERAGLRKTNSSTFLA